MKIAVATLVAVALAAPAMAFDVKWSGDFNNRFSVITDSSLFTNSGISSDTTNYYNVSDGVKARNFKKNEGDSDFFGDIKYRAMLTAADDDKKVKGVLGFEFGSRKYGATGADFGGDDNVFELQYAYTDFEVPFDNAARLSVGLQPVGYNKFVWSDNAGGVKYSATRGDLSYSLGWFRDEVSAAFTDEDKNNYDDVYGLDVVYKVSADLRLNAFVMYAEQGQESYTITAAKGPYAPGVFNPTTGVTAAPVAATPALTAELQDKEIWYGVAADAQAGPIFLGGTFIYLDGTVDGETSTGDNVALDRSAYLFNGEVSTKIDAAKIKLGYLYASGDDNDDDNKLENFDSIDVFTGGFGSAVLFANLADDNAPINSWYVMDKGLSLLYLGGDIDLNDKASVGASYLWWNTAQGIDGEDAGGRGDTELGHELAVRGSYKIATGLTAALNAGYLWSGAAMDELQGKENDADNVFRADAGFRFKF
ncbi:alginate export family protein [Trichloromonas sp.]|uniref:alginate export family protein n=1 Tax=Trichloromonas sp. TaxID=3069249 RepID=UPI003D818C2B